MSPSLVFEPTYSSIKARLMQGAWPGGFRLDTARLAVELGVSKSPVRDSLNRLVGEGMIISGVGEGFHVPRYGEKQIRDLFDLALGLLLAATLGDKAVSGLPDVHAPSNPVDAGKLFRHVATLSGNDELVSAVSNLNDRLAVVRQLDTLVLPDPLADVTALSQALTSGFSAWAMRDILRRYHTLRIAHATDYGRLLAG